MSEKLSPHFSRREFACRCGCGASDVNPELLVVLEAVRAKFSKPVTVVSGLRCAARNARVGGARNSQHMAGTAADIRVAGVPPSDVATWLEQTYTGRFGIGRYASFTHIDVRPVAARWRG